jgi:hypothetical protein
MNSRSRHALLQRARAELRVRSQRQKNTENRRKSRASEKARFEASCAATQVQEEGQSVEERSLNRAAALLARNVAYTLNDLTCQRGSSFQKLVLEKLLCQPVLQHVLPDYVINNKKLAEAQVVCEGVAAAWERLKYGRGRDKYLARNVVEAVVISEEDPRRMRAAAKCIGMNSRTVTRAVRRRSLLNRRVEGVKWAKCDRKRRSDAIDQKTEDLVWKWWREETRVSPCKRHVRKGMLPGSIVEEEHPGHFLEESEVLLIFLSSIFNTSGCCPFYMNPIRGPFAQ